MPGIIENRLIEEFKDRKSFSRNELYDFFKYSEPELKEGTFAWRIYDLKNKNIIKPLMRGLYTISYKPKYKPEPSLELLKLARKINDKFNDVKYCLWETIWLNEFSQHQSGNKIIIIEVEKDFLDSFFYELQEIYKGNIFLTPDEKTIKFYVAESPQPIVIKKLITRSPVRQRTEKKLKFQIPFLEKILVDIFTEDKLFYYSRGSELVHIYINALTKYNINYTKLFSYAKRRERGNDIKVFLIKNMQYLVKEIMDV
ncbi:MAG: hypothetical protein K9I69_04755 [Ignavibacteriales bacterium]|nr:hypothetical protein [Ignavibacteriales bacterium]MCF8306442.1 hypothetical protein [Ignavibacteriales bacterium]MCF8435703.1 hypothetical protein [Ignavibacteriales bacterium]